MLLTLQYTVLIPIYMVSFLFHAGACVLVIFNCKGQHFKHFKSTMTAAIISILNKELTNMTYNAVLKCARDILNLFCN